MKCPRCGRDSWIANGLSDTGRRRQKCRHCGKKIQEGYTKRPIGWDLTSNDEGEDFRFNADVKQDTATIESKSHRIKTLDDAIEYGKIDLKTWEVDRYVINKWEVGAKIDGAVVASPLFQVKVWLKRKIVAPMEMALERFTKSLAPAIVIPKEIEKSSAKHLLELSLFDHHFGKYAWAAETGQDYDLKIAKRIYIDAARDIVNKTSGFDIDTVLLVVGNDFLHINNEAGTTEKGTRQDVDTRIGLIVDAGLEAVTMAIEYIRRIAEVKILWVPGNHDPMTSYFFCRILESYYRNDPGVHVDVSPKARKMFRYGNTMIGFTHGSEEPHRDLPIIMAAEWPKDWSETSFREWHVGHTHKRKQTNYMAADTYTGVPVRVLQSLTGTDAWHYKKGYINNVRAAEGFLYSKTDGPVGSLFRLLM